MLGFENDPHAAFAELFEQHVIAQHQSLVFALPDGPRLIRRQQTLFHQRLCERLRAVGGTQAGPVLPGLGHLLFGEQPRLREPCCELLHTDRHANAHLPQPRSCPSNRSYRDRNAAPSKSWRSHSGFDAKRRVR